MASAVLRGGLALAAFGAASVLFGIADVPAAHAEPECLTDSYDFNGDHNPDYVASLEGADHSKGAVEVAMSVDDFRVPTRVQPAGLEEGDRFGAAVAEVAYYENEGEDERCTVLAVGAPGRTVDGKTDAGAVFLFTYVNKKFTLVKELVQGKDGVPGKPTTGGGFGASLAAPYHADDIGPVITPLYVGAPDADVGEANAAGEVFRLKLSGSDPTVTEAVTLRQGAGVPGHPEEDDGFGTSLAALDDGVIIGIPGENEGAGAVARWQASSPSKSRVVTQNTAGVPGTSEPGDGFGSAVAVAPALPGGIGAHVLVGVPGEVIGDRDGAGSVVVFKDALSLQGVKGYNQDSPGIAGTAEVGDFFGASVATFGARDLIAGAPGEDIGTVKDAGTVVSLSRNKSWSQNSSIIAGTPETGDRFGRTLSNPTVPQSGDPAYWPSPLVGAPGENEGAGLVYYGIVGDGLAREPWVQANPQPNEAFGLTLGKVN